MAAPDRDSLANGLVSIGEEAIAKINDALLDNYYADDYSCTAPPAPSTATRSRRTSLLYERALPTSRSAGRKSSSTATSSPLAP